MTNTSSNPPSLYGATVDAALRLARTGKFAAAVGMLQSLAETGNSSEAAYHLGALHLQRGNAPEAARWLLRAVESDIAPSDAHDKLATAYFIEGDFEKAADAYAQSALRNNNDPRAITARARALFRLKRDDEAMALLQPLLTQDLPFPPSVDVAALIEHRQGNTAQALARVRYALKPVRLPTQDRVRLSFTAAMLCDALGDYDTAFEYYRVANTYKAKPYNPKAQSLYIDRLIEVFSPEFITAHRGMGDPSPKPVFIVGMPRSGTTLTEQILSEHPQIAGAGEMPTLWSLAQDLATRLAWPGPYPGCMKAWNQRVASEIANEYIADLSHRFPDADRVADKLPGNFIHLGLIACMLPGARIIHCTRNPIDTCLSCYFQNFAGNMQPWSWDLAHIGAYYNDYKRLMEHWQTCGIELLEMPYEQTVADLETNARRAVEYLGLPWNNACLRFHESGRVIATASFDQADKPIYDQSVNRWKHYERHLDPLKAALGIDA